MDTFPSFFCVFAGCRQTVSARRMRSMADIYTVLMNSLRKAKATDARHREDVYARARIAYFHKLLGHRPRLDDEHIEDLMSVFDMAVAFVESDVAPTLPTRRTRDLDAAVALLLERQLADVDFNAPSIQFEFTERDIEAEPEPDLNTKDAYRTHVRQAAARVSQWTDLMVKQIDPASVAALSYASASPYDARDWVLHSPSAPRETVDVRSPVALPEPEREPSRLREIRLLRTFFPQEAGDGTISPGRVETFSRRVIQFFEAWSARLYEASVMAERQRRQKAFQPRVFLRTPRYDAAATRQRQFRRNLFNRVMPPAAALATVGIILAVTQFYGREIVDRVEEGLRPREAVRIDAPRAPEPVIPKTEIAASGAPTNALKPDATLFDGTDASVFVANAAHPIEVLGEADHRFARITSSLTDSADARLVIPPAIADRLAGREVHIVVAARSATEDGSGTVRFAYRAGDETTAFVAQPLGKDYRRLELVWNVPGGSSLGQHSILIEPGLLGGGSSVDIRNAVIYLPR